VAIMHAWSQTIRQMIIDVLLEGPATAQDLSARMGIREKEIFRISTALQTSFCYTFITHHRHTVHTAIMG
jgi:hypothetical protein